MKAILRVSLVLAICSVMVRAQVPLGDIARELRANKKPVTKVYTNDDLSALRASGSMTPEKTPEKAGTVRKSSGPTADGRKEQKAATAKDGGTASTAAEKEESAGADQTKLASEFRARYAEQQKTIDKLTRDLADLQQEYNTQTTNYWADAGSQLRNPEAWAKKRKKYEDNLTTTQLKLEVAKDQLEKIKEQAHRAGLPMSMFEE